MSPEGFGGAGPVTIKANPDPPERQAVVTDVRLGAHPEEGGWDRIVFEFRDVLPAGSVAYVSSIAACGSGLPIGLPGRALLVVRFMGAAAHDDSGRPTVARAVLPGPGTAILEARQTCDFEGEATWAVAVTDTRRFKVTTLSAPARIVIDVKW